MKCLSRFSQLFSAALVAPAAPSVSMLVFVVACAPEAAWLTAPMAIAGGVVAYGVMWLFFLPLYLSARIVLGGSLWLCVACGALAGVVACACFGALSIAIVAAACGAFASAVFWLIAEAGVVAPI